MEVRPAVPRVRARILADHMMNSDFSELANFPRTNADGAKDNGIPASVFLDQLPEFIRNKYHQEPDSWILKLKETLSQDERVIVREAILNMPPKKDGENGYPMPWCAPFDGCRGAWYYGMPDNSIQMFKIHRADIEALNEMIDEIHCKKPENTDFNKLYKEIECLTDMLRSQEAKLAEQGDIIANLQKATEKSEDPSDSDVPILPSAPPLPEELRVREPSPVPAAAPLNKCCSVM